MLLGGEEKPQLKCQQKSVQKCYQKNTGGIKMKPVKIKKVNQPIEKKPGDLCGVLGCKVAEG